MKGFLKKPSVLITWLIAIFASAGHSILFYRFSFFPDFDEAHAFNPYSLGLAIIVAFGLQLGLFLSPLVLGRHLGLRLAAILLMVPFMYFLLIPAAINLIKGPIQNELTFATVILIVLVGIYAYNIYTLLFSRSMGDVTD